MAVVAVDGGDERARAREGESREGRRGRERVRGRSEGAAGVSRRVGAPRWQAGGGQSRVEVARAVASRCPSSWQRGRRQEEVGWAALGRSCWPPGGLRGERQVSALFYIYVLFSIFFKFVLPLF